MKRTEIKEAADLALVYFDDGAPFSAARVLRDMADKLQKIGEERNKWLEEHLK